MDGDRVLTRGMKASGIETVNQPLSTTVSRAVQPVSHIILKGTPSTFDSQQTSEATAQTPEPGHQSSRLRANRARQGGKVSKGAGPQMSWADGQE